MIFDLREKLLKRAADRHNRTREEVTDKVRERWGDLLGEQKVYVQRMSGMARDLWETQRVSTVFSPDGKQLRRSINLTNERARLVVKCLADESGQLLFTEADAAALGEEDAGLLDALYDVCLRLNGLDARSAEALSQNPFGAGSGAPPASSAAPPLNSLPHVTPTS